MTAPTRARGTSNTNDRGNSADRAARRAWLLEAFRADVDLDGRPACRCYRCGVLLTEDTVTSDRVIPGALGGRYTRDNLRPACGPCNSSTGGSLGNERKKEKRP